MYSTLSPEEKRNLRKEKKKVIKEYKQKHIHDTNVKLAELQQEINRYTSYCSSLEYKYSIANNQAKKHIKNQIKDAKWNLSLLQVERCKLDIDFMQRNSVHTSMCSRVLKGKECKYEDCWYAHTSNELRMQKCISYMYGCCDNGAMCKYDHSDTPLPEYPKRMEYSYSLSEVEEKELRDGYKVGFNTRLDALFPDISTEIKENILSKLEQSTVKECTDMIISDKLFISLVKETLQNISI